MDTTFYRGQSFTAGQTGVLSRVELLLNSCLSSNDADVIVNVRSGVDFNNLPLATGVIPRASIPFVDGCGAGAGSTAAFAGAELEAVAQVEEGQVYTIWAHSADFVDEYGWWGDVSNAYSGGTARTRTEGGLNFEFSFDLGFKTYVLQSNAGSQTFAGTDVSVEPVVALPSGATTAVSLTFDSVLSDGTTSVTATATGPPPPSGFKLTNPPVYYEIVTTATFAGNIRVCLNWTEGQIANESNVSLFHQESGQWIDITDPMSRDAVNNRVCGTATNLSPFTMFEIKYTFVGFFQPLANEPVVNSAKAGSAVPVRFGLGGDRGLKIFSPGYPRAQLTQCTTGAPIDVIGEIVTAGGSSLAYDASTGRYTYVWKTDKAWGSSCRQLQVKFDDGEMYTARFTFSR